MTDAEEPATYLTADDLAFVKANTKRLAAKPMPEHLKIAVARIWNSAKSGEPA